jgi:hypothetical protein
MLVGIFLAGSPDLFSANPYSSSLVTSSRVTTSTWANASAGVYYVVVNEPGASDSNNGLYPTYQGGQDGPWVTIRHAADVMVAGDTTYIRAGIYYESGLVFTHSGAPGALITLDV